MAGLQTHHRLTGQTAVVTGGASGIGRAIAHRLAIEGAHVFVFDVNQVEGAATSAEWTTDGLSATFVLVDVSDDASVAAGVATVIAESEDAAGVDILVNCAGIAVHTAPGVLDVAVYDRVMAVNLRGAFVVTQSLLPHFKVGSRGGSIVNIASIMSWRTAAGAEAYASSKSALIGFTRTLATSLGPDGVRVNAIAPGYIDTPIWDREVLKADDPEAEAARVAEMHPLGRRGRPDDVAGAVAFLVSGDASFITGETITVDGGVTLPLASTAGRPRT